MVENSENIIIIYWSKNINTSPTKSYIYHLSLKDKIFKANYITNYIWNFIKLNEQYFVGKIFFGEITYLFYLRSTLQADNKDYLFRKHQHMFCPKGRTRITISIQYNVIVVIFNNKMVTRFKKEITIFTFLSFRNKFIYPCLGPLSLSFLFGVSNQIKLLCHQLCKILIKEMG